MFADNISLYNFSFILGLDIYGREKVKVLHGAKPGQISRIKAKSKTRPKYLECMSELFILKLKENTHVSPQ